MRYLVTVQSISEVYGGEEYTDIDCATTTEFEDGVTGETPEYQFKAALGSVLDRIG